MLNFFKKEPSLSYIFPPYQPVKTNALNTDEKIYGGELGDTIYLDKLVYSPGFWNETHAA